MPTTEIPNRAKGDEWTPELATTEHIDLRGHLHVPVRSVLTRAPKRKGWTPFWVNINLKRDPQKIVVYRNNG